MNEMYSQLFSLPRNLYNNGSPVTIESGVLLKNQETRRLTAQLMLRNICPQIIKSATVRIIAFNVSGNPLGDVVDYQFSGLTVVRGGEFAWVTVLDYV